MQLPARVRPSLEIHLVEGIAHVETEGPDGKYAEYEVAYTFGWKPLQQYLVKFPGGRLQALPVARLGGHVGELPVPLVPIEPAADQHVRIAIAIDVGDDGRIVGLF